jgi:hypothetical protein
MTEPLSNSEYRDFLEALADRLSVGDLTCQLCGHAIEKVFGRWYHTDHHTSLNPYDHPATP